MRSLIYQNTGSLRFWTLWSTVQSKQKPDQFLYPIQVNYSLLDNQSYQEVHYKNGNSLLVYYWDFYLPRKKNLVPPAEKSLGSTSFWIYIYCVWLYQFFFCYSIISLCSVSASILLPFLTGITQIRTMAFPFLFGRGREYDFMVGSTVGIIVKASTSKRHPTEKNISRIFMALLTFCLIHKMSRNM